MAADPISRLFFHDLEKVCAGQLADQAPPWQKALHWQAAATTFKYLIHRHEHGLAAVKSRACRIEILIRSLDRVFDFLGQEVCSACAAPCCLTADVYYDFTDLLFLCLVGKTLPPGQPRTVSASGRRTSCRHLGPAGCCLPRSERPWLCTWYICPAQKIFIRKHFSKDGDHLQSVISEIKNLRKQMTALFVETVSP